MTNNYISIPESLRNYLELLHYEKVRYNDLLASVKREASNFTDEEWNDSLEYFSNLRDRANICLGLALEKVQDMYKEEIDNSYWEIDFRKSRINLNGFKDDSVDEKEEDQYADQIARLYPTDKYYLKHGVRTITFQVTDFCNMACTYCYQHNKKRNKMNFEDAKKFIDMLLDADDRSKSYIDTSDLNGIIIDFIGGEPWLEIELISKISDYFIAELFRRKHPLAIKFMFSACSNGLLHFDPRVQEYLKAHNNHFSYSITIDGNKELHDSCRIDLEGNGTYDRAIAAVKDYESTFKRSIGSKLTIAPGNITYLNDAVRHMIDFGYKRINLNCVFEEGWTNEHATELYNQLIRLTDWLFDNNLQNTIYLSIFTHTIGKPMSEEDNQNWCGGTGAMLALDYKGDLYPCLRYMESSIGNSQEPYIIGNLKCGLNCLPEHKEKIACLDCITRRSQSTDECWNCPIAQGCAWCSAYNYEVFGTPNKRATYICCMHKARVLANVYYWRRKGEEFPFHTPKEWALEIISEEEYEKLKNM